MHKFCLLLSSRRSYALWCWMIVCLFAAGSTKAQTITTIAGDGTSSNAGDGGPATAATVGFPVYGTFDRQGNYYFTNSSVGNTVRKISTSGIITTIAGSGSSGYNGDGIMATNAQLTSPQAVAVDTF